MLAVLLQGIVFACLFPLYLKHTGGVNKILSGVKFSLFLGLTVYSVMVFATAAKFQIEPVMDFVLFGSAFQILQFLLVGLVLGALHKSA